MSATNCLQPVAHGASENHFDLPSLPGRSFIRHAADFTARD
jgi:hypothetical protein